MQGFTIGSVDDSCFRERVPQDAVTPGWDVDDVLLTDKRMH